MNNEGTEQDWSEADSQQFLDFADVVFPHRAEQNAVLTSLVPAAVDQSFVVVDLGCGAGPPSKTLLTRFPRCQVIGLDFSPMMLERARSNLAAFGSRFETRQFDLRERGWLDDLPTEVDCFVASLSIHHLDGPGKRALYRDLAARLAPGGALLLQDLIEPTTARGWQQYAMMWDAYAKEQSVRITGSLDHYHTFRHEDYNHYATPDVEFDKPSGLYEQLRWFEEAGLIGADCFWFWYGHAVYGAFKPEA